MTISVLPRGTMYLRSIVAMARAGGKGGAVELARNTFGDRIATLTKSAVDAGSINSGGWGAVLATPEQAEFFAAVIQQSIVGKLSGLRTVPLNTRLIAVAAGMTAHWVGRGLGKPLTKADLVGSTLPPLKVTALFAATKELVRHGSPEAEALLRNELTRAIAEEIDRAFVDASNAGVVDEKPASITNGVTPIASGGNPGTDAAGAVAVFQGDFLNAAWITDPLTATQFALARDAAGGFLFPDVGMRGGSLLGAPFIVSRASPRDSSGGQLVLADASAIAFGGEGVRVAVSDQGALAMQDDPLSPAELVSLWQTDSQAILAEAVVNWSVQREGAVALVTGCDYATAAP